MLVLLLLHVAETIEIRHRFYSAWCVDGIMLETRLKGQHIAHQKSTPQKSLWTLSGSSQRIVTFPVDFGGIFQWMFSGIFQWMLTFASSGVQYLT